MKILITSPSLDETENVSGISTVVRQIIAKCGHEFIHFAAGRKDARRFGLFWLCDQILLVPRFFRTLRVSRPALVHLNTAMTPKAIVRDWILLRVARVVGVKTLLHIHGGQIFTHGFEFGIFEKLANRMLKRADLVIVLSHREKVFVERIERSLDVRVLMNAVSLDQVKERTPDKSKEKVIIFLGRLHKGKGLHEIIEVCQKLVAAGVEFRFRCFGSGDLEAFFVGKMTKIMGEKFHFGGAISENSKWKELLESDVFLLPSHYEGLPMSLLEAMSAGCVPVVSNVGSIGEVVKDGHNGFIVGPYDVSGTIEKLLLLLSDNVDLGRMSASARDTMEQNHSINDYVSKLEQIYEEVVIDRMNVN